MMRAGDIPAYFVTFPRHSGTVPDTGMATGTAPIRNTWCNAAVKGCWQIASPLSYLGAGRFCTPEKGPLLSREERMAKAWRLQLLGWSSRETAEMLDVKSHTTIQEDWSKLPKLVESTKSLLASGLPIADIATRFNLAQLWRGATPIQTFGQVNGSNGDARARDTAMVWMIDNQLARRNLNTYQVVSLKNRRADVLAKQAKANMSAGGGSGPSGRLKSDNPIDTMATIAKESHVSRDTVWKVRQIEAKATPEQKANTHGAVPVNVDSMLNPHKDTHRRREIMDKELIKSALLMKRTKRGPMQPDDLYLLRMYGPGGRRYRYMKHTQRHGWAGEHELPLSTSVTHPANAIN